MYSIFLKGKGGKGIATGAGVVLALVPLAFVIIFATWLVLILLTRYVSVASLTAAALVPVLTIVFREPLPYEIAGVLVAILVWWAHRGNIQRLLRRRGAPGQAPVGRRTPRHSASAGRRVTCARR